MCIFFSTELFDDYYRCLALKREGRHLQMLFIYLHARIDPLQQHDLRY